ncbi:hypothetical protein ACLKA7_016625 [Drosophila subpalustris]
MPLFDFINVQPAAGITRDVVLVVRVVLVVFVCAGPSWQPQQSGQFAALMCIPLANECQDMLGSLNAVSTEDVDEDECEDECEYSYLQVITIDDPSRSPFINAFNVSLRWQVADQVNVPQMQLTRKQLRAADVAILQVMATTKATSTASAMSERKIALEML